MRTFGVGDVVIVQRDVAVDIHIRTVVRLADRVVFAAGNGADLIDLGLRDAAAAVPVAM